MIETVQPLQVQGDSCTMSDEERAFLKQQQRALVLAIRHLQRQISDIEKRLHEGER